MSVTTVATVRSAWGDPRRMSRPRDARLAPRATRRTGVSWAAPVAWAVALACLIAGIGALPTVRDLGPNRAAAATTVKVDAADTLWSIARAHRAPGVTTAETVEMIIAANHLKDASVRQGDVLSVPVAEDAGTAFAQVSTREATE